MGMPIHEEAPVVWRGRMVQTAIKQLDLDAAWCGDSEDEMLNFLFIDMPPGAGDAQITISQQTSPGRSHHRINR